MTPLPPRTLDTMSEAIALSSPNGRLSKRAKDAAVKRLGKQLFGDGRDLRAEAPPQDRRTMLLAHAARLRDLASQGMHPRKFIREAERAEAEAADLTTSNL